MINLDYASHTPADPLVLAEFCRVEQSFPGNVMAAHAAGRAAREEMTRVTNGVANLLGVAPQEIIWTSGASEANNLAIKGIAKAYAHVGKHILSTCLEHPSVSGTLSALSQQGYEVELLKILPNGAIDLAHLQAALRRDTALLCVSAVDSELGAIQPVADIANILKSHPHCHLHIDAAQAVGKIPTATAGASTFCFSPHKFYGICGAGVLVKRDGVVLAPQIHGGASTTIYRSGTPALSLAAAGYKALALALDAMEERRAAVTAMRLRLLDAFAQYPKVTINSPAGGSPYILNLSVSGVRGTDFQAALDRRGVYVSVKSACSTDRAPSRPVLAVSGDKKNALSSWRVSLSHLTTALDIDTFLGAFDAVYKELVK
ncbi:MAG: aminotransferase class V-fold PLP-dependent enzyme [Defluviitaleaceae bacterium]|nr:aminotransferase class V-fold PLP-dependent enzyme [Defluviitaleaceae bacterium]